MPSNNIQDEVVAEPYIANNKGGEASSIPEYIRLLDEERAARVDRRRSNLNPVQKAFSTVVPYGGLISSGFNLASSTIGAGIIGLPSAFQSSGIVMALIYITVIGALTIYSYTLLGIAGKRTGLRNYEQITRALLGPGADYFLAFCLWFLSFGAEVSYVLSLRDVLVAFIEDSPSSSGFITTKTGHAVVTGVMWLVFMLPLCLPREINSLRYFSVVAVSLIVFFVLCMVIHSINNGLRNGLRSDIVTFQTGNTAINGLATFMFSFISQLNCYEVMDEMYQPSVKRLTLSSAVCTGLCFTMYLIAGVFGYLDFGAAVTGSALKLYKPVQDPLMGVAYVCIMIKLCVGYGLHMIPVREAIYHVVGADCKRIAYWKHALTVISMATLSLIGGFLIPRINVVFGLVGGFSGGFIGYVFPALMAMYSGNWTRESVGNTHFFGSFFLLAVGVVGIVFGTSAAIYGEVMANLSS